MAERFNEAPENVQEIPKAERSEIEAGAQEKYDSIEEALGKESPTGIEPPIVHFDGDDGEGRTSDGGWKPNETYKVDGIEYKTDDNGSIYMIDGELCPDETYVLNGNEYTTDSEGRITSCNGKPYEDSENDRDLDAQKKAGGEDRKEGDQGGHIISRDLGGDSGAGNIVSMDGRINQSDYKRMENDIKRAIDSGEEVHVSAELKYSEGSKRPDEIVVTVTCGDKKTVYRFDNNRDGSLNEAAKEKLSEDGKECLDKYIGNGGTVTSVKEEYDSNGNPEKTTVTVTYEDENGKTYSKSIIDERTNGGEQ